MWQGTGILSAHQTWSYMIVRHYLKDLIGLCQFGEVSKHTH